MNRLIAYRANEPERLRTALATERTALFGKGEVSDDETAAKNPIEGGAPLRWGIGYYIGGEPQIQRFAATPTQGLAALKSLRAGLVIAQARDESNESSTVPTRANVPPYRFGRFLLGLHGDLPQLSSQQNELTQALPAFLHQNLRDHSAAERLLHLVCSRLHEADPDYLNDPTLSPEVAVAALAAVLNIVAGPGEKAPAGTLTMTMTNGEWLVIAQRGGPAIWYRPLSGIAIGDGDQRSESYRGIWAMAQPEPTGEDFAAESSSQGYKAIPADHALVVAADLTFQIVPLS